MMNTIHTITAPSGAVLRITDADLRRGWTDPRSIIPGMDPKKLIIGTSLKGLCKRGTFQGAEFTDEDKAAWERERRHPVPLQSFRIRTSIRITDHPEGSTTDLDSLPGLLQRIKTMADPEMPMRHSPGGVQRRMERIRERLDIAINTLRENPAPRPGGLHLPENLAKELIRLVKEAEIGAAYGKDVTAQLNYLRHVLMAETGLEPKKDGWGHTTKDASVEDLFREWAACEAGTDRHEQLFKQLMESGVDQLQLHQLLGKVQATQGDVAELRAVQATNRRHIAKLEEFIQKEFSTLRQELGLTPKATQGVQINCPHPDHVDEARSCTLDLETFKWACPVCKRTGHLLALQDPPPGVVFTPCSTQEFDKAVTEVAGLDSSCEAPASPRVVWEESAPEPDIPLMEPDMREPDRAGEEFH